MSCRIPHEPFTAFGVTLQIKAAAADTTDVAAEPSKGAIRLDGGLNFFPTLAKVMTAVSHLNFQDFHFTFF